VFSIEKLKDGRENCFDYWKNTTFGEHKKENLKFE
jgi:hypothetical protein